MNHVLILNMLLYIDNGILYLYTRRRIPHGELQRSNFSKIDVMCVYTVNIWNDLQKHYLFLVSQIPSGDANIWNNLQKHYLFNISYILMEILFFLSRNGKRFLNQEGHHMKTELELLTHDEDETHLYIHAYNSLGFMLSSGTRVFGPIAIFPKSVLHWSVSPKKRCLFHLV